MQNYYIAIMAGGVGSRFWPSSREHKPKQFLDMLGIGKSLMNLVDKYLISKNVRQVSLHTASKYGALMRFYYGRGFYVESVSHDRGYPRARLVKDYP